MAAGIRPAAIFFVGGPIAAVSVNPVPTPPSLRVARWLLHATVLVPVILLPGFYFAFVTTRTIFFRVLVSVAFSILVAALLRRHTRFDRRDPVFWALAAFMGANALSAAVGPSPIRSMFGDFERMGGVWTWLHLFAYYIALRTLFNAADWARYFRNAVAVGALVAVLLLVQEYMSYAFSLGLGFGGAERGSMLGNPGFLAAYLLANVAIALLLARRATGPKRYVYVALASVFVVGIFLSANRSSLAGGILGTGFALLVYWQLTGRLTAARALVAVFLIVSVAALPPLARTGPARAAAASMPVLGRLAGTRATGDPSRTTQWKAALDGIRERPLFGFGPENYHLVWSRHFRPEMYGVLGTDDRWDRAHNAYLEAFATTGILGFAALMAIWLLTFRAVLAPAPDRALDPRDAAILGGFLAAYAFFLFFWFFDLNSTFLWLALVAFLGSRAGARPLIEIGVRREPRWQTTLVLTAGGVVLVTALYVHAFETLCILRALDQQRYERPVQATLRDFRNVFASPAPATFHAFLLYSSYLRWLMPRFDEIRADPHASAAMDSSFALAFRAVEQETRRDPLNERVAIQKGRIALLAAAYYRDARYSGPALASFQRAVELAPRRVHPRLVLGNVLLAGGQPLLALRAFEGAYAAYPPLAQTHAYMAAAHAALGDYREAARWLMSAWQRGFGPDSKLATHVIDGLMQTGDADAAADLGLAYLARRHGPLFMWSVEGPAVERLAEDRELVTLTKRALSAANRPEADVLGAAFDAACVPRPGLDNVGFLASYSRMDSERGGCLPFTR